MTPLIGAEVQVDRDVLDAIQEAVRKAPGRVKNDYKRAIRRVKPRILADIRDIPPPNTPADYPLRWKSAKQRRYVMAKLREDDNLPYQRTGELQKSWDVNLDTTTDTGVLLLESSDPKAIFVQGDYQQPMFIDSGYPTLAEVVSKYDELLTDILIDTWYTAVDGTV
jgi:hypothetical protein